MPRLYRVYNGPAPTTAAQAAVTTGTTIKTMLQLAPPSTAPVHITGWGVSGNGSAAAAGIQWELLTTGTVFATVTAHVAAGLVAINAEAVNTASNATLGTAATGYTATVEGTITASRMFDSLFLQPTGAFYLQRPLGTEVFVPGGQSLRIRCTAAAAISAVCWIDYAE